MQEKNLVIVESPAKAKTIERFLGKDFLVRSSYGHVRDLPRKGMAIDIEKGFKPQYEISEDKKEVIKELKKLVKEAEMVWLATDEDREGEAISWHLKEALELDDEKTRRITFNEITKNAIEEAIQNPRNIDLGLVKAQQARRILDRLVGFELSPVLWKKVKPSLSAGRVQSVAVRLLVEREREIRAFKPEPSFKVNAEFDLGGGKKLHAELPHRFKTLEEAEAFLERCAASNASIEKLETKPGKRKPAAPFTTSTLQQEAARKLGFSVSRTMTVAQQLYESGWITYMRTDSVNLSNTAIQESKQAVLNEFGADYSEPRNFTTKNKGAQEAHEAIRPVSIQAEMNAGDDAQRRLYDLIRKRTLASQMAEARLKRTTATIGLDRAEEKLVAKGEVLEFDGFLRVYKESSDEEEEGEEEGSKVLPPLEEGQKLTLEQARATERFSKHPPRYTEASLVKKLEELGIGRPSTYAPIISTVQKRGYVVKEDRQGEKRDYRTLRVGPGDEKVEQEKDQETVGAEKQKLFPTDMGMVVNDFLMEHFQEIMDYNFTASVEKQFDDIASGGLEWDRMIKEFYQPFHQEVEETLESSERATGERVLGKDPKSGRTVIARIGRYGPMVQMGKEEEDGEKPRFASLRKGQSIEDIELQEALDLFKLPRDLGEYNGEQLSANIGRFGPYVRLGNTFASLKQEEGDDPYTVDRERAIELIEEKKKAIRERTIQTFEADENVQVLKGKWGPYIKIGRKNFKVPKEKDPAALTLEECYEIAENAPAKKGKGGKKGGSSKSSASASSSKKGGTTKKSSSGKSGPKKRSGGSKKK